MRLPGMSFLLAGIIIPCSILLFSKNRSCEHPVTRSNKTSPLYNNVSWAHFIHISLGTRPHFTRLIFKTHNNPVHLAIILLIAGDISQNPGPLGNHDHCTSSLLGFANINNNNNNNNLFYIA